MKPHQSIGVILAVLVCAMGFWALSAPSQKNTQQEVLLQKAIQKETVDGDLPAAIKLYQQIVANPGGNRSVAAKAQLHLGFCYEKSGLKQAQEAFQRVIDQYPEQGDAVKAAKERLSILLGAQAFIEKGDKEFKITKIHTERARTAYLSPDGKRLALIDWKQNNLWLRNIASGKEVCLVPTPEEIDDCFWSPDSKSIAYITGVASVKIVSSDGGQPKTIIEVDPEMKKAGDYAWPMGWTPDSKKLIFQVKTKGLFAIPASGGKWEEIYKFPDPQKAKERNEWLTLSPDGKFIAYQSTQAGNQDIYVMPARGGESVRITDDAAIDRWPVWSYDGQWLAFNSARTGQFETWVIRITPDGKPGSSPIQVTRGGGGGVWTQDGKIAYSTRKDIEHVFVANTDGSQETQLTKLNNGNMIPRWSPDGKTIAFIADYGAEANRTAVWTVSSNGGDEKLLAVGNSPVWSPDGKKIAFCNERGRLFTPSVKATISIIPAEGGEARELMNYDGSVSLLDWSPDGKHIAFDYGRVKDGKNPIPDSQGSEEDIYVISVTGGEPKRLTRIDKKGFHFTSPRWSPDGKKIAFRWMNEAGMETGTLSEPVCIYTIDVEGGEPKLVTDEMDSWWFCFSRDGKNIIFSKHEKESEGPWVADHRFYKVSAEGGKAEKLNIMGRMPDFSPDGKRIVLSKTSEYRVELWLVENFLPIDKKEK